MGNYCFVCVLFYDFGFDVVDGFYFGLVGGVYDCLFVDWFGVGGVGFGWWFEKFVVVGKWFVGSMCCGVGF